MRLLMIRRRQSRGLTLVEAILLLVIVSIVAVAAGVGLQAVVKVPGKTDDMMAINSVLVKGMPYYEPTAMTINGVNIPAGTLIFQAKQVHVLQ